MAKSSTRSQPNWKKRILLPIWIVRICLMLVVVITFALTVGLFEHIRDQFTIKLGTAIAFFALSILILLLDVVQIILFLNAHLHPGRFFAINALQTAFWLGVMVLSIIEVVKGRQNARTMVGTVFIFVCYLALLVYAALGWWQHRSGMGRGAYAMALNPAAPLVADGHASGQFNATPVYSESAAYRSPMQDGGDLGLGYGYGHSAEAYSDAGVRPKQMV